MQIIPAILSDNVLELEDLLRKIRDTKKFSRVQIDFIDGKFSETLTVRPRDVDMIPYLPLKFDAHLMVTAENMLFWHKEAQAINFARVFEQCEQTEDLSAQRYVAVDLETEVTVLEPYIKNLDTVLLLSVKAGHGGQTFDERVLPKITWCKHHNIQVCVDGGLTQDLLPKLEELGVDEVAVGAKRVLEWN